MAGSITVEVRKVMELFCGPEEERKCQHDDFNVSSVQFYRHFAKALNYPVQ